MGSGRGWLGGDWPSTGGVLNITAVAWTAGFQWWRSGDITRTQNVSEYMLVLAVCLVTLVAVARIGNVVGRITEATLRRARLVPGWVTVFGRANHLGMQPATQANSASYPQRDGK